MALGRVSRTMTVRLFSLRGLFFASAYSRACQRQIPHPQNAWRGRTRQQNRLVGLELDPCRKCEFPSLHRRRFRSTPTGVRRIHQNIPNPCETEIDLLRRFAEVKNQTGPFSAMPSMKHQHVRLLMAFDLKVTGTTLGNELPKLQKKLVVPAKRCVRSLILQMPLAS